MDPNYTFPPKRPNKQCIGSSSRQHTNVRYVQQQNQSIDIPGRKGSQEVARPGSPRNAGIGGYTNLYRKSGIGNNLVEDRNSGIGKQCYQEGGNRLSESFSSVRRLSSIKRGASFSGKKQQHRKESQTSVISMPAGGSAQSAQVAVQIESESNDSKPLASRSTSQLSALNCTHGQQWRSKQPLQTPVEQKRKHNLRKLWRF